MNIRRWGGWLLAILGVTVTLALGCEKGALGVKVSTLTGRMVDMDQPTLPVVGAKIVMISQQAVAGQAEIPLGQNMVTMTDANGVFIFENVGADKLLMEAFANGYEDFRYPTASATVPNFYLGNNTFMDLGTFKMRKVANPLTVTTVVVKGKILDGKSMDELADGTVLSMYFDGKKYGGRDVTYGEFKAGLTIPAKLGTVELTIIAQNYATYKNTNDAANTISGSVDNVLNITLTPVAYDVRVTLRNKPAYLNNRAIELNNSGNFAMVDRNKCTLTISSSLAQPGKPFKVLATSTVDLSPYEPDAVLSGISLPASLTVLLSGYKEIDFSVPYTPDTQGMIAMKLDMDTAVFTNNRITRPVVVTLFAKNEANASDQINLRQDDNVRIRCLDQQWGLAPLNTFNADATPPTIRNLPCGYILPFEIYTEFQFGGSFHFQNFYYIDPVLVPLGQSPTTTDTFTANLLISQTDEFILKP